MVPTVFRGRGLMEESGQHRLKSRRLEVSRLLTPSSGVFVRAAQASVHMSLRVRLKDVTQPEDYLYRR